MMSKLKDRIDSYIDFTDYKLLPKLPLIISVNGRSFSKATSLLDKPYSDQLAECFLSTTVKLCQEIDGALFAFQHSDEILVIVKNDQTLETEPWFDNKIQKICSVVSSIASLHFNECAQSLQLNLLGKPIFITQAFVVPNITEAINTVVNKQQQNFYTSIQFACFYELIKKYDKNNIRDMLHGLSIDEKIDLLNEHSGISFNSYPAPFRRGAACYKFPKIVDGVVKNKWMINDDLPIFTKNPEFLSNIIK